MCSPFMSRFVVPLEIVFLAVSLAATAQGQVLHTVPKVGQWVEFDGELRRSNGTTQAVRARFACVDAGKVDETPAAWIEVEWTTRDGSEPLTFLYRMKLLVPTKLGESDNPRTIRCTTYVQYPEEPAIRPAKEVPEEVIADIRGRICGCVPPKGVLTEGQDEEILIGEQSTKTKSKLHRFVQTDEDGDKVEYRFWLADTTSFGVAKFAYRLTRPDGSGGECEMTFRRKGDDAQPRWPLPAQ
jgi:hypothetical protein